jgi:hypothetical protein
MACKVCFVYNREHLPLTEDIIISVFLSVKELGIQKKEISVEEEGRFFQVGSHFRMSHDLIDVLTDDDKATYSESWSTLSTFTGIMTFEFFLNRNEIELMQLYYRVLEGFHKIRDMLQWEWDGDMLISFPSEKQFIAYLRAGL